LTLERHSYGAGRARTLLGKNDVGLAGTRVVSFADSLAVQQNHHVGILLE
jgi:hypothetical protein